MYPSFTLYPGGAFMLCESIGDIPYHPVEGEVAVTPADVNPRGGVVAQKIMEKPDIDEDPVVKTISKLSKVYETHVKPLLSMNYTYEDPNDAIFKLEQISSSANTAIMALHRQLVKMSCIVGTFSSRPILITRVNFDSHLGYFMKNATRVHQEGIETYPYEYSNLPAIADIWVIRELGALFYSNPELLEVLHTSATLGPVMRESPFTKSFDGFADFLQCVFENPDRLMRLESKCSYNFQFDYLLNTAKNMDCDSSGCSDSFVKGTANLMAMTLKKVCRTCYDLECAIVDGTVSSEIYQSQVTPVLYSILNIFGFGMMVTLSLAYEARAVYAQTKALEEYTNLLLTTLKTH